MGMFPYQPVSCACDQCKGMCEQSTCLPLPFEARDLIRLGYGPRLAHYRFPVEQGPNGPVFGNFIGPAPKGMEGARNLPDTKQGACTFYTEDGKCELHDLHLKPEEGRLAAHDRPWLPIRMYVGRPWLKGKIFDSINSAFNRVCPPKKED